jgi:hypothetical protein
LVELDGAAYDVKHNRWRDAIFNAWIASFPRLLAK